MSTVGRSDKRESARTCDGVVDRKLKGKKLRFFADGPVIPNELLTYRDRGEVVFFCGAGVSVPVGLPTFFELTKQAMSRLGVSPGSQIGQLMAKSLAEDKLESAVALDRVFGYMQREYSRETVEREVNALLKTPRRVDKRNHESILQLSSDAVGNPFVVTTNFDLMFEKVNSRLRKWIGPYLPTLALDESPTGIVYLHGRLGGTLSKGQGLILGSGDFGRAYLADGWATSFMRDLLERRIVVLLGYSANDPPVRYLLDGLHAGASSKQRSIYAFDRGDAASVREKWKELGIVGIGYDEYSDLWSTLGAWAKRTQNKAKWITESIDIAAASPRILAPHERGRVAELVSTPEGAKAFSEAEPPPPAEWICVFDKGTRYASVERLRRAEGVIEVDPHLEYRLDDDPPRASGRTQDGVDLLEPQPFDTSAGGYSRLSNMASSLVKLESARLRSVTNWLARVSHHPAALWWAARQHSLHPDFLAAISRRLALAPLAPTGFDVEIQKLWSLLHEVFTRKQCELEEFYWLNVAERVRVEGWTKPVVRAFENAAQPTLLVKASFYKAPLPPASLLSSDAVGLLRFEVSTLHRSGAEFEISDAVLRPVVRVIARALERAVGMLEDTEVTAECSRAPALEPDSSSERRVERIEGLDALFLWFAELFERLCAMSVSAAREESAGWPHDDGYFFDRLRLHFWRNRKVFDGGYVGAQFVELSDKVFWNPYIQRELLHLLRDRWSEFAAEYRLAVENRLIDGRKARAGEPADESEKWNIYHSGVTLGWLQRNACNLSKKAERKLSKLRKAIGITEEEELSADRDWDGKSGWVEQRYEPGALRSLPIGDIVKQAQASTSVDFGGFVHEYPFAGLVSESPRRAYLALCVARKKGEYPESLWRQLISHWPETVPARLLITCAQRLAALPAPLMFALRHDITRWLEAHAYQISGATQRGFWAIWDQVFSSLISIGPEALRSALTYSNISGAADTGRAYDSAVNAPIGRLVEAAFATLGKKRFAKGQLFPADVRERLETALNVPGDARYHVIAMLGGRLHFIFSVDCNWVIRKLMPQFVSDNPSSAALWSGIIYDSYHPYPDRLFKHLKANFLSSFPTASTLLGEETERRLAGMLVEATFMRSRQKRYVSFQECRVALQSMSESGRLSALWSIGHILVKEKEWATFGALFFTRAWPREVSFRTSSTSESLIRLATNLLEVFGEVVDVIEEYLTFVDHPDNYLFGFLQEREKESVATRWPAHALTVLTKTIRVDARYKPYQLEKVLEAIADADRGLRNSKRWRSMHELLSQ